MSDFCQTGVVATLHRPGRVNIEKIEAVSSRTGRLVKIRRAVDEDNR